MYNKYDFLELWSILSKGHCHGVIFYNNGFVGSWVRGISTLLSSWSLVIKGNKSSVLFKRFFCNHLFIYQVVGGGCACAFVCIVWCFHRLAIHADIFIRVFFNEGVITIDWRAINYWGYSPVVVWGSCWYLSTKLCWFYKLTIILLY